MTTDEALLWARERCSQEMPTATDGFMAGKWDNVLHLRRRTEAYRAGQQSAEARVKELEAALRRAAGVLEWLAEFRPDCFGYEPPFPSETPSIRIEATKARAALGEKS